MPDLTMMTDRTGGPLYMNLEDPRAVRLRAVLRLVYPHHRGYSAQDARRPAAGGRGGDDFRHRAGNLYGAAYVEKIASGEHQQIPRFKSFFSSLDKNDKTD